MKKGLSIFLAIVLMIMTLPVGSLAETVVYDPIEVVFKRNEDSAEFRQWAASIVKEYLNSYCKYDHPLNEKALYDYFYQAAQVKKEYDQEKGLRKQGKEEIELAFSTMKYDYEEWVTQEKQFYMYVLSETIQEKNAAETGPASGRVAGGVKFNVSSGQLEYDPQLSAYSEIDEMEIAKDVRTGILEACTAASNTLFNIYFNGEADVANVIVQAISDAAIGYVEEVQKNAINAVKNLAHRYMQQTIANRLIQGEDRIIGYLESTYLNDVSFSSNLISMRSPMFVEAVEEMIKLVNEAKKSSVGMAEKLVKDWESENDIEFETVLDEENLKSLFYLGSCKVIVSEGIGLIEKYINQHMADVGDVYGTDISATALLSALKVAVVTACDKKTEHIKNNPEEALSVQSLLDDIIAEVFSEKTLVEFAGASLKMAGTAWASAHNPVAYKATDEQKKSGVGDLEWADASIEEDGKMGAKILSGLGGAIKALSEGKKAEATKEIWKTMAKALFAAGGVHVKTALEKNEFKFDQEAYSLSNKSGQEKADSLEKLEELTEQAKKYEGIQKVMGALSFFDFENAADSANSFVTAWEKWRMGTDATAASFIAHCMYVAYEQSYAINHTLKTLLVNNLMTESVDIVFGPQNILDPNRTTIKGIKNIIENILMQTEFDAVGTGYLLTILQQRSEYTNLVATRLFGPPETYAGDKVVDSSYTKASVPYNDIIELQDKVRDGYAQYK